MERALERLPSGARICVIRLRSLGDCVLTTPALRLLKAFRPDLEVAMVVEPRFRAVFDRNPDVSRTLDPRVVAVARFRPDLLLNFHGGTSSIVLTVASRARHRAAFAHFRAQSTYNIHIPTAQEILGVDRKVHTAEHLASAMFYLGVPPAEIPRACLFPPPAGVSSPYALLHPFASLPEKTWPAEHFLVVAKRVAESGLKPVFLCGPGEDASPFKAFETVHGLPLEQVMGLVGGASLFVGNDSGPAHIAAACGVPGAVLFAGSDPVIWSPWKAPEMAQIVRHRMSDIAVDDVLGALEGRRARA